MPGGLTEVTELATALGMLRDDLDEALAAPPPELVNVGPPVWERLAAARASGAHDPAFAAAFANGRAFASAVDGLRGRRPVRVEWKGPHRPPGVDVVPADLRIDHVYLVSCKYLSRVLVNAGPARLFHGCLAGEQRAGGNWFGGVAPGEFQAFYEAAVSATGIDGLPDAVGGLSSQDQRVLKAALGARSLPDGAQGAWLDLCVAVSEASASRWQAALRSERDRTRMLWRMLRIPTVTYFVLGSDRRRDLRLRVDSAWDWVQGFALRSLEVAPRRSGQPEVGWTAVVRHLDSGTDTVVHGHVEVRWSHGRFLGALEAKVYLDVPHHEVPGYHPLA